MNVCMGVCVCVCVCVLLLVSASHMSSCAFESEQHDFPHNLEW